MRPRVEVGVALVSVAILLVVAAAIGRVTRTDDDPDTRASTFLAGRHGARGIADAASRLGVSVVRWRTRPRDMVRAVGGAGKTFVVLTPSAPLSPGERDELLALSASAAGSDLVVAGTTTRTLARCFGFDIRGNPFDSSRVAPPGIRADDRAAWARVALVPARASRQRESLGGESRGEDDEGSSCAAVPIARADTLLTTPAGAPVVVRVHRRDVDRRILLVSDGTLLRNSTMRQTSTGPLLLDALIGRSRTLVFDEYHHGFGPGGSLPRVVLDWSVGHPGGWFVWQLAIVGLLALLASGVRFGPIVQGIPRTRRSALEHVRALATALAAARGHDVAIGAIVRGLRRRLAPVSRPGAPSRATRDDSRAWLESLVRHAPTAKAEERAMVLVQLSSTNQPGAAVRVAANAVEDLWEELRP